MAEKKQAKKKITKKTSAKATLKPSGEKTTKKSNAGRKALSDEWLTEEGLILIQGWKRNGLTNEQIAKNIGISITTLYLWQSKHSEFMEALKKGREVVDQEVENALYKSAMGFEYDEIIYEKNKETGEMIEVKRIRKTQLPSNTAQIFWLKNRRSKEWREKQQVEVEQSKPFEINIKVIDE